MASGGIYQFRCKGECGRFERFTWDTDVEDTHCPVCNGPAEQIKESTKPPGLDFDRPLLLRSIGVAPSQIEEAKRRFPDHEFAPDGRMIIRSYQQHKQVLRDLGFTEY